MDQPINFGGSAPLPHGYIVVRTADPPGYRARGPGGWESPVADSRFDARRWAITHFLRRRAGAKEGRA